MRRPPKDAPPGRDEGILREWRKRSPNRLMYRKRTRFDRPTLQTLGGPPPDPGR